MRPSQQKNRMRGRGRKQPNPLSRNYESNGPDVKIRGNASHIAEKYAALSRDAMASGDRVIAENYLQHAEHYNRIIAAAAAASSRSEEGAGTGKGPQPDVQHAERPGADGGDSPRDNQDRGGREVRVEEQTARSGTPPSGDAAANVQDGGERPKREPRGKRRTRKADDGSHEAGNGAANGADGGDQKAEITEDAAKLPGNLIGMPGEDNAETGASQDD